MRDIRVAKPYARALYAAASEQNVLQKITTDIDTLQTLIEDSEEITRLIYSPVLPPQFKSETVQQHLADRLHPLLINFLKLLVSKQRERYLIAIINVFAAIADEAAGRLVAKVTTAVPLIPEQAQGLTQYLSEYSGKQVRLETTTDTRIRGGFIVQLDDTVFDASIATQLQRLRHKLEKG